MQTVSVNDTLARGVANRFMRERDKGLSTKHCDDSINIEALTRRVTRMTHISPFTKSKKKYWSTKKQHVTDVLGKENILYAHYTSNKKTTTAGIIALYNDSSNSRYGHILHIGPDDVRVLSILITKHFLERIHMRSGDITPNVYKSIGLTSAAHAMRIDNVKKFKQKHNELYIPCMRLGGNGFEGYIIADIIEDAEGRSFLLYKTYISKDQATERQKALALELANILMED